MKPYRTTAGLALALAFTTIAPLGAQQSQTPPTPGMVPDSIQELVTEFQTIRERLAEVQDSALEVNPQLIEDQQAVQAFVEEKMAEQMPTLEQDVQRMETLQQEAMQAQATQDTARLAEIVEEGTRIQQSIEEAQATTMQREDVQTRIEAFEEKMVQAMTAIDPGIDGALARMQEIADRLQAFQQGG